MEKQLVVVVYLESIQLIAGLLFGLGCGYFLNLDIEFLGVVIIIIFILLLIISLVQPALLRILFFFMGIIVGLMVYYLLNIVDFIPAFS